MFYYGITKTNYIVSDKIYYSYWGYFDGFSAVFANDKQTGYRISQDKVLSLVRPV